MVFFPQTNGAVKIYTYIVRPFLKQNEESLERSFDKLQDAAIQATGEIRDMFSESLVASSLRLFAKFFSTYLFPFIFKKNNQGPTQQAPSTILMTNTTTTTTTTTTGPLPPSYPPPSTAQGPSPPPYLPPRSVRQK